MEEVLITHAYFLETDIKESLIQRPYPPLGLLYVAAYLNENNIRCEVIDSTFMNERDWLSQIKAKKPAIIAIYCNMMTKPVVLTLLKELKKTDDYNPVLIAGGPDVTHNTENYLGHGFDFTVTGEGEQTLLELSSYLLNNEIPLNEIRGVSYMKDGKFVFNGEREQMKEIDSLPFPARDAVDLNLYLNYWEKHHGQRTLNLSTQRGCPYTCKWCSTTVYGQSYRRISPERVAREIALLKDTYQVANFWFVDDVFTINHKWISGLKEEVLKHRLSFTFECVTRAERLTDQVLMDLKEMGCTRIWIGAESGSPRIIDRMDRKVELDKVREMFFKTKEAGIEVGTFIMIGYPGETKADIIETARHLAISTPSQITITQTYPIKGTDLYNEMLPTLELPDWETTTDRDIELKLPYKKGFYYFAIRYIVNHYERAKATGLLQKVRFGTKAKVAFLMMNFYSLK